MNASFRVFFLLFALSGYITYAHDCDHDSIEQDLRFLEVEEDMASLDGGRILQSGDYPNIRIHAYFDYLAQTASSSYYAYVANELIPPAIDYFEAALRVKYPVSGNLKLGSNVNGICERSTPSILQGSGVATDFFIYFDSQAVSGTQIANTKYCYLASGTKRPLIARTMINRNMLPIANGDVLVHEKNMYTMMHEMIHGLGFSGSTYKLFIDANGNTLQGHLKSVKINGYTRTFLDVAPLTDKLRNHFGCSSLEGALLENQGGSATAASHFERKVFLYESMTSGSIADRRISEMTLALLEGSGWYAPDYNYAEPFFFGKGQGCSFVTGSSCSNSFDEFCSGSSRGCSPTGRSGGFCNSDPISDGCKYYNPNFDYDCENDNGADYARLPELQVFGRSAGSKCFTGTLNSRSSNSLNTFCFRYTCSGSGSDTQLQVQVGNHQVTCAQEGSMTIDGYYGTVNCPDPLTFCNTVGVKYCPRNCMGRGTCVNGTCRCNSGYSGIDCALNV
jgi:hypothetical protein